MSLRNEYLLAIPVFNEEKYVAGVLSEARDFCDHILVVDDGSTDATPDLLATEDDIAVITHAENRGYGKSLGSAFGYAERHGYPWLITMDCDEQHEATQIPRFLEIAERGDADVISGTRYPADREISETVPEDRRKINQYVTELLNRCLGLQITDAFCGFKAYRVSTLRSFQITVPGYAMPMQFWVQAARAGLRICELDVPLIYNDPTRYFGGLLDDPSVRLEHYLEVFYQAMAAGPMTPTDVPGFSVPCP